MNLFRDKKLLIWVYSGLLVWGLTVGILIKFCPIASATLFFTFFWLLLAPGFALGRIFKISLESIFEQKLLSIVLGLIFSLLICLIAILLHLNITVLLWVYLILIAIIFCVSIILEYLRPIENNWPINPKKLLNLENLIPILLALFAIIIISVISQIGANFDGDPAYHLAIMRKAIDNQPLSIDGLSYVKNQPMPAYAIMIWPVFLSLLAKLTNLPIYNLWGQIPAALTLLVFLSWYGLFRRIFKIKYLAALAVAIFVIFMFEGNGYLLTRLAVPDTLAKLILSPLALWLALKYIFDAKPNLKILTILTIFLPLLALIHLIQYFYFYLIMIGLIIFYLIFRFKDADYWATLKKMLIATFSNLLVAMPIFGLLQAKSGLITASYHNLSGRVADPAAKVDSFTKFDIFTKYAYIFYPLVILFIKKYRILLIVLASLIIAPIIFHTPVVYNLVNSTFSFVFMKRLFSNVTWYFAIWALLGGFMIILIDRWLTLVKPIYRYILSGFFIISAGLFWFLRGPIYNQIFSSATGRILNQNFWWLIILMSLIAIIFFIWQLKSPKMAKFFALGEPRNTLVILILSCVFISFLCFSAEKTISENIKTQIKQQSWIHPVKDYFDRAVSVKKFGGWDTLKYIQNNISAKSIFESDFAYRDLPVMLDVHMAGWPNESLPEKEYSKVYESEGDLSTKLQCLAKGKSEYLLISVKKTPNIGVLEEYLTKIYQNEMINLYQIDQNKIHSVIGSNYDPLIDCRARQYTK